MLRADTFAGYLEAELFVLQASQPERSWHRLFRREQAWTAVQSSERLACDRDKTRARCEQVLPGEIPAERLLVRQGDFVREVARAVAELSAELAVIPPLARGSGLVAMHIALAAQVPVLIARPPRRHNIVVAATNLADHRYPVIRRADQIGTPNGAQLVLVHNVEPQPLPTGWESGASLVLHTNPVLAARCAAHLDRSSDKSRAVLRQ